MAFFHIGLFAQTTKQADALSKSKQKVEEINHMELCKRAIVFDALPHRETDITLLNYKDMSVSDAFLFYYDASGRIRKFIYMSDYPEYRISNIHYFDTAGYVVHSVFFERNAMDYALNGIRYMDKGRYIYQDIDLRGESDEVVSVFEQYDEKRQESGIYKRPYDMITHTDSLPGFVNFGKPLSFTNNDCKKVIFSAPKSGETAMIDVRQANIHEMPSINSEILCTVESGDLVKIPDDTGTGWYKVETRKLTGYTEIHDNAGRFRYEAEYKDITGYIGVECLEYIERDMNK